MRARSARDCASRPPTARTTTTCTGEEREAPETILDGRSGQAAQQLSLDTSRLKVCAANLKASANVK